MEPEVVIRAVTVIMGTVIGLTFLFGFGNVLDLALHLGVPVFLGARQLALTGGTADQLRKEGERPPLGGPQTAKSPRTCYERGSGLARPVRGGSSR